MNAIIGNNMKRLVTLLSSVLLLSTTHVIAQTASEPILRMGVIADTQYGDCDSQKERHYRKSLDKLDEAVKDLNGKDVQFTLHMGDLVDRNPLELATVMDGLKKLSKKVYITPGNHDYKGIVDNNMLFKRLGMPAEYYSVSKKKWRIIFLNTNEVASYANVEASNKAVELKAMQDSIDAQGGNNNKPYNGGISKRQIEWLKSELAQAEKKKEFVIVCTHHPLYPESELNALNDKEILDILQESKLVKLVLSGHNHAGGFGIYKDLPCITLAGMVETDSNAYGILDVYENKFVLQGVGRLENREVGIR